MMEGFHVEPTVDSILTVCRIRLVCKTCNGALIAQSITGDTPPVLHLIMPWGNEHLGHFLVTEQHIVSVEAKDWLVTSTDGKGSIS